MLDKLKKLAVVVFLTLLIWAYAYLALEETVTRTGTLNISRSTTPELFVSFDRPAPINLTLKLKGPASRVAEFKKFWRTGETDPEKQLLGFYFNVEEQGIAVPGTYTVDVMEYLQESEKLNDLGLAVEEVSIPTLQVNVERLVEKRLDVQVRDMEGNVLPYESIDPASVSMHVRPGYEGPAVVTLTQQQINQARKSSTRSRPYVMIDDRQMYYDSLVSISLPVTENPLQVHPIQPRVGLLVSQNLQGRYDVELLNEDDLKSVTTIKATREAFEAYSKMQYQVLVEVRDGDENIDQVITRPVTYNFPMDFVRSDQIMLNEPVREARFRLTPIQSPQ